MPSTQSHNGETSESICLGKTYKNKSNNVILIGDAAHAMLPHQGAGAGQGLEDALILAKLLEVGKPSVNIISSPGIVALLAG